MQDSRLEQKIEDIYAFVESCKMQMFSDTNVVVPKNDLYDLLDDLRRDVPEEIKRYRKILNQRDAILEDAETKAAAILADAQAQYSALIEEHSIMQEAYQQAQETVQIANEQAELIISQARQQANQIGDGAMFYASDMLNRAEKVIAQAYESTMNNARALEASLRDNLETIRRNKAELVPTQQEETSYDIEEEPEEYENEFETNEE